MSNLLILPPAPVASVSSSGGSGIANLLSPDPREVWLDSATGSRTIGIDLGAPRVIDTIFLGYISGSVAGSSWRIDGGLPPSTGFTIKPDGPLRVADSVGQFAAVSHALWHGVPTSVQYLTFALTQPGSVPLGAGIVMVGSASSAALPHEFGAGRGVKDTGSVTRLPSGGLAIVEGARVGTYAWTLGDLTQAEADALYALQKDRGETRPVLVVEDPAPTTGLANRIHYGLMTGLKRYERRNAAQIRWDFSMEEWT